MLVPSILKKRQKSSEKLPHFTPICKITHSLYNLMAHILFYVKPIIYLIFQTRPIRSNQQKAGVVTSRARNLEMVIRIIRKYGTHCPELCVMARV